MTELSDRILKYLSKIDEISTLELAKIFDEDHQKVIGALKSIQASGNLLNAVQQNDKFIELTDEGKEVAAKGKWYDTTIWNFADVIVNCY